MNLFYDEKSGSFKIKPFSILSDNFIIEFGPDVNMDAKLSYLTLNPMMKAKSGGFYFGAGLALGFVLDKKIKFTSGYIVRDINGNFIEGGTIEEENKIEDTKTRFALPIGAGYDFKLGGFKIFIEARYDLGLTKVAKDSEWKVSSLQFLIGARYGF
ncbi:Outer membrane protein beta-barrel domain-containing protein [Candidatus Kryptobacter tengchongensis]|nr:Outer membrane protein beta-barrel domain-containing protein [Candidatus Kryptobacter tengchongensis]